MLTLVVPRQLSPSRQRMQVYLWTGVIFVMYSVLVSLFKEKNRGTSSGTYPTMSDRSQSTRRLSVQAASVDVQTGVLYKRSALLRIRFRFACPNLSSFPISALERGGDTTRRISIRQSRDDATEMYKHAEMIESVRDLPPPNAERADYNLRIL